MQLPVITPRLCALVPHSTRPVWHQWESFQQPQKKSTTARRRLFPEEQPAEEENKQFVQRLLNELSERYKQKWNFDFELGRPVESDNSAFQYEAVPANQVPGFYRMTHKQADENKFHHGEMETCSDENHWSPVENVAFPGAGASKTALGEFCVSPTEGHAMKSPSRALKKARRSVNQTPKKTIGRVDAWMNGQQAKITDFMAVRKGMPRSATKEPKLLGMDSSPKRRRHSLVGGCSLSLNHSASPIKKGGGTEHRRSQRVSALLK